MTTQNSKAGKSGINKARVVITNTLLLTLITGLLIWSIRAYFNLGDGGYTNDAQVEEFINPINSKVPGYIKKINFTEHQPLTKGDTLVVLDDREIRIQVAQAEAALQNALAAKEVTLAGINTIRNNITVTEANMNAAKARLNNLKQTHQRYASLLKEGAATQAQFDQINAEYEAALAQYQALEGQRKTIQLQVNEATQRVGLNDGEIKRATAALEMAQLNLSYCNITAPYNCTAGRRQIQEGQLIQPGQLLLSIVKSDEKWVVANFREKQMEHIQVGKKVAIEVDALNGKAYEGVITAISGASGSKYSSIPVDNSTGNFVKVQQRFPVRIELTGNNTKEDVEKLRAGMNVIVNIKN
ncbi:MAG: HlyD family secretion protein [Breznakibacter sp.]